MGEALRAVRDGVTEAGRARWEALRARVEGGDGLGARIVLARLDPTIQGPHETGRAILHRQDKARICVPMDMEWAQRVGHLREVQTLLGFRRETRWEAIATIVSASGTAEPEFVVKLGPIFVPDQLLLEEGGIVPGLEQAVATLDKLQAQVTLPHQAHRPEQLLPVLFKILETHHWRAFRDLFDQGATLADRKVAFEQFTQAWEAARGVIAFEGYAEPLAAVDEAHEGAVVRTRLTRKGEKGEDLVRPIKWVKRGAGWRLTGGLL
jgi:hypothetical protein